MAASRNLAMVASWAEVQALGPPPMMRPRRASRKDVPDGGAGLGACAGREIEAAARESESVVRNTVVRNTVREGRWEARKSEQY
jgi:hypothetical protein